MVPNRSVRKTVHKLDDVTSGYSSGLYPGKEVLRLSGGTSFNRCNPRKLALSRS